jgi:tight adherence protein C
MYIGIAFIVLALAAMGLVVILLTTARAKDPVACRLEAIRDPRPDTASQAVMTPAGLVIPPTVARQSQVEAARRSRQEVHKTTLRDRLVQAGLYNAYSPMTFVALRIILAMIPFSLGLGAAIAGKTTFLIGLGVGGLLSAIGTLAPTFWLDYRKSSRQKQIRRALPDALDVIVVCMEGGLSLTGAFARVAQELAAVHPLLAMELRIAQREVQMGRSTGEALRAFAKRFDIEELRSLAAVICQAERFGTSIVKALSVYSETMRLRRHQRAEMLAHQATVKMIFPTLLCIFPAIFIVVVGPAAIQIMDAFRSIGR